MPVPPSIPYHATYLRTIFPTTFLRQHEYISQLETERWTTVPHEDQLSHDAAYIDALTVPACAVCAGTLTGASPFRVVSTPTPTGGALTAPTAPTVGVVGEVGQGVALVPEGLAKVIAPLRVETDMVNEAPLSLPDGSALPSPSEAAVHAATTASVNALFASLPSTFPYPTPNTPTTPSPPRTLPPPPLHPKTLTAACASHVAHALCMHQHLTAQSQQRLMTQPTQSRSPPLSCPFPGCILPLHASGSRPSARAIEAMDRLQAVAAEVANEKLVVERVRAEGAWKRVYALAEVEAEGADEVREELERMVRACVGAAVERVVSAPIPLTANTDNTTNANADTDTDTDTPDDEEDTDDSRWWRAMAAQVEAAALASPFIRRAQAAVTQSKALEADVLRAMRAECWRAQSVDRARDAAVWAETLVRVLEAVALGQEMGMGGVEARAEGLFA